MIDERHQELASLYALDLLEGAELVQFETALARDPALRALVRELREAAAVLAHAAPAATPPPALKARVLASLSPRTSAAPAAAATAPAKAKIIPFAVLQWGLAACLALGVSLLAMRHQTLSSELRLAQQENQLINAALQLERTRLDRDRALAQKALGELGTQVADANRRTADATQLLADARTQVADKDRQIGALTQRVDALAGASATLGRELGAAKEQIASLTNELKLQGDIADLKITTLASLLNNSPQAVAVAAWNPTKQAGVLQVGGLPPLAPNEDYQLWVVDSANPDLPIDGGVFTVDAKGNARFEYKAKQPLKATAAAFAISRERKGGVPKAEGPIVLLGK